MCVYIYTYIYVHIYICIYTHVLDFWHVAVPAHHAYLYIVDGNTGCIFKTMYTYIYICT